MKDKGDHVVRMNKATGVPEAPVAFRDAVEMWARNNGRHGDLVFCRPAGCWQVKLSPMPNDPRMALVQKGQAPESELWETVELVEPKTPDDIKETFYRDRSPYKAIPLGELGISGLTHLLDKGNMWSKRGEFDSIQEALVAARTRGVKGVEEERRGLADQVRELASSVRRQIFKIPYHRVGINLTTQPENQAPAGEKP